MPETVLGQNWYAKPVLDVLRELEVGPGGLSATEAISRQKQWGPNEIHTQNGQDGFQIFLNQLKNPLIIILVVAGGISLALKDVVDAAIVAIAVALNVAIGFFQEYKVSHILQQLAGRLQFNAVVIRDGFQKVIDSKLITVGDIMVLRSGDKVSADGRLISASDLRLNEAALTGESMPEEKNLEPMPETTPVGDRSNMAYMGTFVEEGLGQAVVTAVGPHTEFGKIAELIARERGSDVTPLQKKLQVLAKFLGFICVGLSILLFIFGVASGRDILLMFLTAVAVAVAAVPESLPVAVSVILAIGARRILARGGLIRKMSAAEALGETTVIASDKTATLTEGKMHVAMFIGADRTEFPREQFAKIVKDNADSVPYLVFQWLSLNANSSVENPSDPINEWRMHGKPIDKAIYYSAAHFGFDRDQAHQKMPRLDELPFDSKYKYSASLNQTAQGAQLIVFGAPEVVLKSTTKKFISAGQESSLPDQDRRWFLERTEELASQGFRVLMLSVKNMHSEGSFDRKDIAGLSLAALVVFSDPIRPEAPQAILVAKEAGMRPIMITGDHLRTAQYVAVEVGITDNPARVIEAKDLPADLAPVIDKYDVFARVSPEDKVRIVKALTERGETVAMLGDGINDAPALLRSDIGVAVGSGTDVAKEAADLVLLNDSFEIIVEAIRQGRIILDNIKKVTIFLLSSAFSEILLVTLSILLGLPLPLLPAQILWVNIIQDGLPAVALAFERREDGIMKRKPERKRNILTPQIKWFIGMFTVVTNGALFALLFYLYRTEAPIEYIRTMAFGALGITSLLYIFSVTALDRPVWRINPFSNRMLVFAVGVGFALYALALYAPFVARYLETVPLNGKDWLLLICLSLFNILVIEVGKRVLFFRKIKPA